MIPEATRIYVEYHSLLEQLKSAGVAKRSEADPLTDADKQQLLNYLQASHGTATSERKKITLVKKSTSEIKQADATGKARTIQVEVRKKRTFIKRDDDVAQVPEATPALVADPVEPADSKAAAVPLIDDAELARRHPGLPAAMRRRWVRSYGSQVFEILARPHRQTPLLPTTARSNPTRPRPSAR